MGIWSYIAKRTVYTIITIVLVTFFLFLLFRLMPGSVLDLYAFTGAKAETLAHIKKTWGLDEPLYMQFIIYFKNFITGKWGFSISSQTSVRYLLIPKLENTFVLMLPAIVLGIVLGWTLGLYSGKDPGSKKDRIAPTTVLAISALPIFLGGLLFQAVFASKLGFLPTSGMISPANSGLPLWKQIFTLDFLKHWIMPFICVTIWHSYLPLLITRSNTIEISQGDFVMWKRSQGLSERTITKHLAKNGILPLLTIIPVMLTFVIGGQVLIETVFNWPGIGFELVHGVLLRDYPLIQPIFFIAAIMVIIGNFLIDIIYGVIDPRIRIGERR